MSGAGWHVGNAKLDGEGRRGWFVGHFMPDGDLHHTAALEIKWGVHPAGEAREAWQGEERRTTVLLLIEGRFRIDLSVGHHVLTAPGDYAMWGPGIGHAWKSEKDSVVLTVRWPSVG